MENSKWILGGILVLGVGFWLQTPGTPKAAVLSQVEAGFNYSMPKSRGIHSISEPTETSEATEAVEDKNSEQITAMGVAEPAATAKAEVKKTAKKDDQKKKDAKKQAGAKKKKKTSVNVVSKDSKKLQWENFEENTLVASNEPFMPYVRTQKATEENANPKDDKKKVSESEWKQMLLAAPTSANLKKFLAAYALGEVSRTFYYEMIGILLAEQKPEAQQLGLEALRQDRSSTTFRWLATNLEKFPSNLQGSIREVLVGYAEVGKLVAISQVLQSKDKLSVTLALEILQQKITTLPLAAVASGNEPGREPSAEPSVTTRASYMILVSPLKGLVDSDDAEIAALAQSVLNLLTTQA